MTSGLVYQQKMNWQVLFIIIIYSFIIWVIFQAKMAKILWFQLLKCEDFLLFFVLCERKVNIFAF